MNRSVNSIRIAVVWGCLVCLFVGTADSQERQARSAKERTVIPLNSLPPPPAELAKWIRLGNVKFVTGGDAPNSSDSANRFSSASRAKLDAATTYRFAYKVPSQSQWKRRNVNGTLNVNVKVKYQDIQLIPTHEIWLRNPAKPSRFWSDKLVRHELDHVRISSDPRWQKRFAQTVQSNDEFTRRFSSPARSVGLTDVNRWINEAAQERFEEINQLIDIRYRELDRWTDHGRRALPKDVTVESLISSPNQGDDDSAAGEPAASD